jgi:hypothetical protein
MLKSLVAPGDVAAPDPRDVDRSALGMNPDDNGRTGLLVGVQGSQAAYPPALADPLASIVDSVLTEVASEVLDDPGAVGLLLHGSRALGTAGRDSNYDFIAIVNDSAYAQRKERGTLEELRFRSAHPMVAIAYESLGRLRRSARRGGVRAGVFADSRVLVDKTGDIKPLVSSMIAGREPPFELVTEEYDGYLNGFSHSLKASSRGDDLGARAHAAEAGLHLLRALFALEGKSPPYLDQLSVRLSELDDAQGWRPGFLRSAMLRLFYAPDPPFQQMLDRRVSRLMDSRGIRYKWRHDLEQIRRMRYDEI